MTAQCSTSDIDNEGEESSNKEERHGKTENINPTDLDETDLEAELDEFISGDCVPASAEVYFMEEMDIEDTIKKNMDQDQAHAIPPSITPETDTQVLQSIPNFPKPGYNQENSVPVVQGTSMSSEMHKRLAAKEHQVAAEETAIPLNKVQVNHPP
ncbi:hypothetical protein NLJ89_g3515 [Agrocybe chaxingu]|uniref:Uncharacterized protein n=1 Tax=Agrocybe chaxingu TaxID=84603 RepID=A0A9W8K2C4_9AGAR|nr:hypothetical protein NLJ89_g3515 [Agrocybe chaxingu]